jgi:opacity protein-like surface antigen
MKRVRLTVTRTLFLAIGLALVSAGPSAAEEAGPGQYVLLKLGVYSPQHDDMDDYDEGFNGEIHYGRYFHKNYASEVGVGYFRSDGTATTATTSLDATLDVFDITYTIKGIYSVGKLELFAGPGIGLYFAKVNSTFASGTVIVNDEGDWNTAFGLHVLAGVNVNVRPDWFVGLEGKYFFAKTKDSIIAQGGAFGSHLDGLAGSVTLGWRF